MADPFPVRGDGVCVDQPYADRLGMLGAAGGGNSFVPRTYRPALQQHWRIGVQREITRDMVVEFFP